MINQTDKRWKLLSVVGARPNFMKIAPLLEALAPTSVALQIVHTGQHYDPGLSATFFEQLRIPSPDIHLEVGSGSHAVQTAEIMKRFEPVLEVEKPDGVLVVGDVNSTVACSLVAAKKFVPVIHVEAGLRSFDRTMPEEINRLLTDQIADVLYVTERDAVDNLKREGIPSSSIELVGNVMVDALLANLPKATTPKEVLGRFGFNIGGRHALLTLHRPSNVDDPTKLEGLLRTVATVAQRSSIIFPIHPRTKIRVEAFGLVEMLRAPGLFVIPPVGYLEMVGLIAGAHFVLTDSGGVQEETTALGVPCLTLRTTTERPVTVSGGTNTVVGTDQDLILNAVENILATGGKKGRVPELWDGRAAQRIAQSLELRLSEGRMRRSA